MTPRTRTTPHLLFSMPRLMTLLVLTIFCSLSDGHASVLDRVVGIDNTKLTRMKGNVHPLVRPEADLGRVNGSTVLERIMLVFKPSSTQQAELDVLLHQQQDSTSSNYHKLSQVAHS